jgi:hypothetical protein
MSCNICQGTGWIVTERGAKECQCRKAQQARDEQRTAVSPESITVALKAFDALAWFPKEPTARVFIGDAMRTMCPSAEALQYLVRIVLHHYTTWEDCGIPGLRQIVCTKFKPADGIESEPTKRFPDGLPSETKHEPLALPPGAHRALPAGHVASGDAQIDQAVDNAATTVRMPKARVSDGKFERLLRETITAPCDRPDPKPAPEPMSLERRMELQAEIDALREKRAQGVER